MKPLWAVVLYLGAAVGIFLLLAYALTVDFGLFLVLALLVRLFGVFSGGLLGVVFGLDEVDSGISGLEDDLCRRSRV